jgi:hypothetical protein
MKEPPIDPVLEAHKEFAEDLAAKESFLPFEDDAVLVSDLEGSELVDDVLIGR